MTEDFLGLGDPFLRKHDILVELREDFRTPAIAGLSVTTVLTTDNTGEFTIEDVPYGNYVLFIKRPGYLVRCMNITISDPDPDVIELAPPATDPLDNGMFMLWAGDCNDDLLIDFDDSLMILDHWDINVHDPNYDPACDLNADGRIDNADIMTLNERFGYSSSQYAGAEDVDFFVKKGQGLSVTQGAEYCIPLSAQNIASFAGEEISVTYDPNELQLINVADQLYDAHTAAGAIPGTGITITSVSPSSLKLTFEATILSGKTWSGVITILKFKALITGTATMIVEYPFGKFD